MCRLLAWTGATPRTAADALGASGTDRFIRLGTLHRDGWGMAWWPPGGPSGEGGAPAAVHSTAAADRDPAFRAALESTASRGGVVHLRWATPGLPVVPANCHPFVRGCYAVAHNGGIYPLDRIGSILPPALEAQVLGTTDSERYAVAVADGLARGGSLVEVIGEVVGRLFAGWSPTSCNAVVLTPEALAVVCAFDPAVEGNLPEPATEFYRMRYRDDPSGVVVASSGFEQPEAEGWADVGNGMLLVAPLDGGPPQLLSLGVDVTAGASVAAVDGGELR